MAKKPFIEFMGMKLDLSKTKNKVQYERKFGSPMKEIFKLMSLSDLANGNMEDVDYTKLEMMNLDFMANLLHAGAQRFNANISMDVLYDMIDLFLEDHTLFDLMGVCVELLEQAGYLNFGQEEEETKEAEEADAQ